MSKIKLNFDELENICGGKLYLTLLSFDEHQPYALMTFNKVDILFNPGSKTQVELIKKGNPIFGDIFYLCNEYESTLQKFTSEEICTW